MCKKESCGGCALYSFWCIAMAFAMATYVLIIYDIVINSMILTENTGAWEEYCTGGNFLHKITIFALITGIIGLVSGNTVNIIMFILYYAMHYNALQQESGDCQTMKHDLYKTVLSSQKIMYALLLMSIPSALVVFIACQVSCGTCCYVCCEVCKKCEDDDV